MLTETEEIVAILNPPKSLGQRGLSETTELVTDGSWHVISLPEDAKDFLRERYGSKPSQPVEVMPGQYLPPKRTSVVPPGMVAREASAAVAELDKPDSTIIRFFNFGNPKRVVASLAVCLCLTGGLATEARADAVNDAFRIVYSVLTLGRTADRVKEDPSLSDAQRLYNISVGILNQVNRTRDRAEQERERADRQRDRESKAQFRAEQEARRDAFNQLAYTQDRIERELMHQLNAPIRTDKSPFGFISEISDSEITLQDLTGAMDPNSREFLVSSQPIRVDLTQSKYYQDPNTNRLYLLAVLSGEQASRGYTVIPVFSSAEDMTAFGRMTPGMITGLGSDIRARELTSGLSSTDGRPSVLFSGLHASKVTWDKHVEEARQEVSPKNLGPQLG